MTQQARIEANDEVPEPVPGTGARRRRVVTAEVEELFSRQRTPASALPDPRPLVLNLSRCVIEILAGVRDLEQIARWIEPDVHARLLKRTVLAARARAASRRAVSRPTMTMGSCRVESPADGVVEAAAVVHLPARSRVVAMRLVGIDGRWRATELGVL